MDIMLRLQKKYDEKRITEIEKDVEHFKKHANSAEKSMVETLHYLETTERFKENASYKNSTFDVYVKDRFCITPTTYQSMRKAYHFYRDEAIKYGPGLIKSIEKKCGTNNVKHVLDEIKAADSKTKKPISRSKIQEVIEKNAKSKPVPKLPKMKDETDWKRKYKVEKSARVATEKELEAAKEQIARLKDTVLRLKAAQVAIEQAAMAFQEAKQLAA